MTDRDKIELMKILNKMDYTEAYIFDVIWLIEQDMNIGSALEYAAKHPEESHWGRK